MKVVIGLVEHIGDIVACEPVARYVKMRYAGCSVAWVVNKAYRELVDSNPHVDETVAVDCLTDWIKISRHGGYDKVIDLHVNYRVCSHCRVPLIKDQGNPFINAYEWLDYGALLEAFSMGAGLPKLSSPPRLYLGAAQKRAVDALGLPAQYCVIHRESNNLDKDWTRENWQTLARWIANEVKLPIVEIGVRKGDAPSPLAGLATDLTNRTSILETAEVIRRARFFIGVDSGPSHLANAVGTPGIVLLGRMGAFRQYTPYTGLYGSVAPEVKLVRNLLGPARELAVQEVIDATRYVASILNDRAAEAAGGGQPAMPAQAVRHAARSTYVDPDDRELLRGSSLFDPAWYALHHEDVEASGVDPAEHFLTIGGALGYRPGPHFDTQGYLKRYLDVTESGVNPLLHFIRHGEREGRIGRLPAQPVGGHHDPMIQSEGRSLYAEQPRLSDALDQPEITLASPRAAVADSEVPRTFAFYLPQFHPIPENNWAHGPGFTEWNNVIKAKPLFTGHYQPKIPGELGYYDLRSFDVMRQQVELATEYGISGLCFYYYYFHGKKLLYKPIENYIGSDLKMPFFFLWANENWSKRWDGGDNEVIIAQQHSKEDDLAFIRELMPVFEDDRYTKVNGKPILCIYKAHLFPDILSTTEIWRDEMARRGFPGIYLVMVDDWTPDPVQPRQLGFDASYEIPSNMVPPHVLSRETASLDLPEDFTGRIVDYDRFARFHMSRPAPEYRRLRTVMLPWDNTPRYGSRALVHINTDGDSYRLWLSQAMLETYAHYPAEERIVFLHSWNEWCEGTYLEPDGRRGRRYLEETRDAIADVKNVLALRGNEEQARALALIERVQRVKDEGAYRILQAARMQSGMLWRDRETARAELAARGSHVSGDAPAAGPAGEPPRPVLARVKRRIRRMVNGQR
ncbi:glycoside hydrolase family 99-like domain-containing protein [Paraburkholderia phosphatilytica]|uniref:glycoside hydrolase family 99-like domain-containing protein n=1 Tax=Paraburkholderia phosphatilytica TaxID=2282883 RepID=UPI000E5109C8|nr:glycoside hydrolase family 99-like domain-containing protein [Paraburkholderia phosphatilytica]